MPAPEVTLKIHTKLNGDVVIRVITRHDSVVNIVTDFLSLKAALNWTTEQLRPHLPEKSRDKR